MPTRRVPACIGALMFALLLPTLGWAQSMNASIGGTVMDPTGAAVPNVQLSLTAVATGAVSRTTSGPDGLYSFPNLPPGVYELKASAQGFRDFVQRGIELTVRATMRLDVSLTLGTAVQTVEVTANASPLNFDNAERKEGITPETVQELPLLVSGGPRSSASFAILMPGVSTGGTANPFDSRINGGLQSGDEAIMDGVSMQQGFMSQTGMVSLYQDFPMTPDMVSELKLLTSNYEPMYGSTLSSQIIAVSKSGTSEFHGGAYEYHRNTWLNARPWGAMNRVDNGVETPGTARPKDIEHDIGGFIGGPFKIGNRGVPGFWSGRKKSYFYVNYEAFRIAGGVGRPTISIASLKERNGDFTDWKDAAGNLIPIYDPATTRPLDPTQPLSVTNVTRDQFQCNGVLNVICPDRFANSLAKQWLQYLPNPTNEKPQSNYLVPTPVPDTILAQTNYWLITGDQYIGDNDHIKLTIWYQGAPPKFVSLLPRELASESNSAPQYSNVDRANWDHTFTPNLLNHWAFGYLNRNEGYGCVDAEFVDEIPKLPGVALYNVPPQVAFDGWDQFGCGAGRNAMNITRRPTYVTNDLLTWVRGKHTFKFGAEYRNVGGNIHQDGGQSGYVWFGRSTTGLPGINSGNPIASFLLELVDSGNYDLMTSPSRYPRQVAYIWHFGDTWKVTSKLSINYGVRWDEFTPSAEKWDRQSFLDPFGANPGAGGRPGRLAFAGNKWGAASFGKRFPEEPWRNGFAPRLGIAYSWSPKTVVRTGYGIFYTQAFYPGWGGGVDQAGFNANMSFSSTMGGLQPAFILSQGFPEVPADKRPPFMDPSYRNGRGLNYRPFDANRLSYAQQWNLSIEHQFTDNFFVSAAYVGTKGTRLPSTTAPINAINPSYLAMGGKILDEFAPGQTTLHGVSVPYDGWIEQLQAAGCSPTVAQALRPYPQYCDSLRGLNENAGNSTYHSFQFKAERRFARGAYLLVSYTLSKLIANADNTQRDAGTWSGTQGVISPFERQRNKALASDDVPHVLSAAFVYDLPFGSGKRFLNTGGIVNKLVGGWEVSGITRASSGIPFYFRSSTCAVPAQFHAGCIPGILPGANPWAQDKSNFDPNRPLFNAAAFEPVSAFELDKTNADKPLYYGVGPRMSNLRGFGYHNQSLAFIKNTKITERLNFQLRAELFNLFNWHIFTASGEWGSLAFNNDIASGDFGKWNGSVTNPRNIQVGARLTF